MLIGARARSLLRARRAQAGLEFAILLPMMIVLLCGTVDASLAIMMSRRLTVAAASVATIASTIAVQSNSQNKLSGQAAWQATTAPFALFPGWRPQTAPSYAITLSAVNFAASPAGCTSNCSYSGSVIWSAANPNGQPALRPCGSVAPAADSASSSLTTLPADDFGATSLLVADVSGVFTPLFATVLIGPLTMLRSAYVSPRVNNGITLTSAFPGPYATCAGNGP